jgi:hypothetical protein
VELIYASRVTSKKNCRNQDDKTDDKRDTQGKDNCHIMMCTIVKWSWGYASRVTSKENCRDQHDKTDNKKDRQGKGNCTNQSDVCQDKPKCENKIEGEHTGGAYNLFAVCISLLPPLQPMTFIFLPSMACLPVRLIFRFHIILIFIIVFTLSIRITIVSDISRLMGPSWRSFNDVGGD